MLAPCLPGLHRCQALVVVLAVRLPDLLATQAAADQRDRRVDREGGEDQQREPGRPDAAGDAETLDVARGFAC